MPVSRSSGPSRSALTPSGSRSGTRARSCASYAARSAEGSSTGAAYAATVGILAPSTRRGAMAKFGETIGKAYATEGAAVELGTGVHDGELDPAAQVKVALRMTNRHGLIAGATGTGKTR